MLSQILVNTEPLRFRVRCLAEIDLHGENILGPEARIRCQQFVEAANKQKCAYQQQKRQGHLPRHQSAPQAKPFPTGGHCAPACTHCRSR